MGLRWRNILCALPVTAAAAFACSPGSAPPASPAVPTSSSPVVRTDVASRQSVNGTIGYGAAVTIAAPTGSPPQALAQAQAAVDLAAAQLVGARQGAADARAVAQQQLEAARAAVDSAQAAVTADQQRGDAQALGRDQAALVAARAQLAATGPGNSQHVDQAQAVVTAGEAQLASARRSLAPVAESALVSGGSYTWLPAVGSVVERGLPLYEVGGRPVPLFFGERPAWRRLAPGASGADVKQLEENLLALGFGAGGGLVADGSYGAADAAAVRKWQASLGVKETGVVDLGAAVFRPGPGRVTALRAAVGSAVQPGGPILDLSATERVVTVALDTAYEQFVRPEDAVTITLPDNRTTARGRVTAVGAVASTTGQEGQASQGGQPPRPTVQVTVGVPDQQALGRYDQAPVRVSITDAVHRGVLAVPVIALLAQPEGGYAVRVMRGTSGNLVRVEPGLFGDGGLVEVTGRGLVEGTQVQVPRT